MCVCVVGGASYARLNMSGAGKDCEQGLCQLEPVPRLAPSPGDDSSHSSRPSSTLRGRLSSSLAGE